MIIEIFLEEQSTIASNVICLAGYIAENGSRTKTRYKSELERVVPITGCKVISLAERRSAGR